MLARRLFEATSMATLLHVYNLDRYYEGTNRDRSFLPLLYYTSLLGFVGAEGNALWAASWYGHEAAVRLLLDRGADVNARGGDYSNYSASSKLGTIDSEDFGDGDE